MLVISSSFKSWWSTLAATLLIATAVYHVTATAAHHVTALAAHHVIIAAICHATVLVVYHGSSSYYHVVSRESVEHTHQRQLTSIVGSRLAYGQCTGASGSISVELSIDLTQYTSKLVLRKC